MDCIFSTGSSGCINPTLVCDGIKNCPNGADEDTQFCQKIAAAAATTTTTTTSTSTPSGSVHLFNAAINNAPAKAREILFFPFGNAQQPQTTTTTTTTAAAPRLTFLT